MAKESGIGFLGEEKILFREEWLKMTDNEKLAFMNKKVDNMGCGSFSVEAINAQCEKWWMASSGEKQAFVDELNQVSENKTVQNKYFVENKLRFVNMEKTEEKSNMLDTIRTPYVWADFDLCKTCGRCINVCPKQVIGKIGFLWNKHIIIKDAENCIGCKKCIRICPYGVFSEKMPDSLRYSVC